MLARIARKLKHEFQVFRLKGDQLHCNYCNRGFKRFLVGGHDIPVLKELNVIGGGKRDNCYCPNCYSADRDRAILHYLRDKTSLFSGKNRVLHIAPDDILKKLILDSEANYTAGDKFVDGYSYSGDVIELDVLDLPFTDEEFDIIICSHVLEHIHDDVRAMKELFRVLKKGGLALLQVPISLALKISKEEDAETDDERIMKFGQRDHVRIYGLDFFARLKSVGFTTERFSMADNFPDAIEKFGLNKNEDLFLARRES